MNISSKQKKVAIIVLIVLAVMAILGGLATGIYFGVATIPTEGIVIDAESNAPIANVSVTDGRNVVKTGEDGRFKLKGWHKARFVTITNPTGYWTEEYYQEIDRKTDDYTFTLTKRNTDDTNHTFMQITDTEINENGVGDWFNHLKKQVEETNPAFLIHTGDICYEAGLKQHIVDMNSENMGIPVRYTIGNHDFVQYGKYSEQLFEDNYGPVNYSFDVGNIHYIVSSLAYGDYIAKYNFNDVVTWIKNDLETVDDNKRVIIFNHDVCRDETGMVLKSGTQKIELKKEGVIGWINGHLHYNFINNYDGILNISTTPLVGGIDSSIGGVRLVDIENNVIKNTYMRYTDYEPDEASQEGYEWQVKLSGRNLYADPVLVGDKVYVGMMDNDYPRKPVFACLNVANGETIWEMQLETSVKNNFYINDGVAVVQDSSGIVYGLDADTGRQLWKKDLMLITYRYSMTGIVGEGDKVYCGNSRFVYCLNVKTGEQLWKANKGKGEPSPYKMQIIGDQLIIGDNWRAHYALDKNSGKLNWILDKWINAQASAFSYKDNIYLLNGETIIKLDPKTGKIIGEPITIESEIGGEKHNYNFNVASVPYLDKNIAYIATNKNGVIAMNMDTLQVVWECNTDANMIYASPYSGKGSKGVESTIAVKGDLLYLGAMDGNLYVVNKNTGEKVDTFRIGAPVLSKVIIGKDTNSDYIVVSDFEGRVTRINLTADGKFNKVIANS